MPARFLKLLVVGGLAAFPFQEAFAADAKVVYTVSMRGNGIPADLGTWGRLVLATIQNNQITNCDTLTSHLCLKPWFSFSDGNKFVCFKSDKQIAAGQVTGTSKWFISVFDIPSRTFTDLLEMPSNAGSSPGYGIVLRWPAGDWIYYHRPQTNATASCNGNSTGEIWRINSKDPGKNEMVLDYFPDFNSLLAPGNCQYPKLENWHISADLSIAEIRKQYRSEDNWSILHWFPPYNADDRRPDNFLFKDPNCNPGMSPSGKLCCCFTNGGHQSATFFQWDESRKTYPRFTDLPAENGAGISTDNFNSWSGGDWARGVIHWPEWAANSDRYLTVQATQVDDSWNNGANVAFFSMRGNVAVNVSNNPDPGGVVYIGNWYSSAFIEGGPANGLQELDGNWTTVEPVEVLPYITSVTGTNPYHLTLASQPQGAEFHYTTDGTEPTQSSPTYSGQATVSVPEDTYMWFKAKAFVPGETPSNSARRRLLPCEGNGAGATCELWKGVTGTQVSDLTSSPRYPDGPDETWVALELADQYCGWWCQNGGPAVGESFGFRIHGYLLPPITGAYQFRLSSTDGNSSLRVGTSSDPRSAAEVVSHDSNNGGSSLSADIEFKAGKWYYFELLRQADNSGGYRTFGFGCGWKWPTGEWESPVPRVRLMPMDSIPHDPSINPDVDTLRFTASAGGANPADQSVALTLGTDAPTNPQFTVTEDAPWLTTTVQGLQIQNDVDISGLASGYYSARIIVSAQDMLSGSYTVFMKLDGPPIATRIAVQPSIAYVMPNESEQFGASVFDQFGEPFAGAVAWSVSGGGAVSGEGLFTSDGTEGNSTVYAQAGGKKDSALVRVGTGSALPPGLLKELLCLETADGRPYLPKADADGIEARCTGTNAAAPGQGDQITVNGNTYTWRLRRQESGVWANGSYDDFVAYWFVNVMSPTEQQVKVSIRHDDDAWVWSNGVRVGNLAGWGEGQTAAFALKADVNRMLFRLNEGGGGNEFAARIVDLSGQDISGLSYYPSGDAATIGAESSPPARPGHTRVMVAGGALRVVVGASGAHAIAILDARGRLVRAIDGSGVGEYSIDRKALGTGVYLVEIRAGGNTQSTRIAAH